jgi:hypothetical protein
LKLGENVALLSGSAIFELGGAEMEGKEFAIH